MLDRIENSIDRLSRAESRVASWVLAHPRQTADATVAEVAKACDTSEPTVIRFCRSVGLNGFRELTIRLAESLSRQLSYVHRDVSVDDSIPDAVDKVVEASINSLLDLRGQLSALPIGDAVDLMNGARQIAFAGLGGSGHVASDACHKFFRLGIPCTALTDAPSILQFAAVTSPGDVIVLASHSGTNSDLCRAAESAAISGANVIAITTPGSRLADAAEIVFDLPTREDASVYPPMNSRLMQLTLFDTLLVALSLRRGETAIDCLKRSKAALRG